MASFPLYHHSTHYTCSYIYKFAFSDCSLGGRPKHVVAIYSGSRNIAFCSPGDMNWSEVDTSFRGGFEDVTFYPKENCFYAVRSDGALFNFQPGVDQSRARGVAPPPVGIPSKQGKYYLVVMSSSLYLVLRKLSPLLSRVAHPREFHYQTVGFEVYRFDLHLKAWEHVFEFSHAIFLGSNTSFSVAMSDYNMSKSSGIKSNMIYYSDDSEENFCRTEYTDIGLFDFEHKRNEVLNLQLERRDVYSSFSPATYYIPSISLPRIVEKNAEVQEGSMVQCL